MSEERPVRLHFFKREWVEKFIPVAASNKVEFSVEIKDGEAGFFVETEPVKSTVHRKLIADWAKASMEDLT